MKQKSLFMVVDGPSASGKNTLIQQVLEDLDKLGIKALSIEETKEKDYDRKKILAAKERGDKAVVRAIIDERKKLYKIKVIPQLTSGVLVVANRGEPTTLAYQTIKSHLTMEDIWNMHRQQQISIPDLVVLTNCNVEEAIRRENLRRKPFAEEGKNSLSGRFSFNRKQIHTNYKILKDFLEKKGIYVIYLNTDIMNVPEESQRIIDFIKNKLNYVHEAERSKLFT